MPKANLKQRLSYWLDHQLSRKPLILIAWLGLVTLLLVVIATLFVLVFKIQPAGSGLKEVFWDLLFQALTPNPFDATAPLPFLFIILVVTLLSLLMVSILIGLLTASIESRLAALRRGRSKVLEKDHNVILGWSHQIFTIVSELVIAHENRKHGAVIVIMADRDKVEMDRLIRERIPNLKNTRVICRTGTPMDLDDLEIVSPHTASSIIVLPPDEDNPDSYVIKTILAIVNSPNRRSGQYHIVTEIESEHNRDVIQIIGARDDVQALLTGELVARVIAQTSRQSGLSIVYTELLNFSGDEIYFQTEPKLAGKTYGDALLAYDDSSVMGLRFASGEIKLNPRVDTQISLGDQVIAISRDYNTVKLSGQPGLPVTPNAVRPVRIAHPLPPEKGLILGWNSKAPLIIKELENYVAPGSELLIVSEQEVSEGIWEEWADFKNQRVMLRAGDISDRKVLNSLDPIRFQHIIVLAYDGMSKQSADAETMVTLLHLRDITEKKGCRVPVVSEMLDLRNRRLADVARIDDFIVSDHLVSLMLAQVSENIELYRVFSELFDAVGPELYLKPLQNYIDVSQPVSFATVVEATRQCGETAIGYRIIREMNDAQKAYGIYINPKKSNLVAFTAEDRVIVLADRQ